MRFFVFCLTLAASSLAVAQTVPVVPRTADRDLQQLHQDLDRYRIEEEINSLRQNSPSAEKSVPMHEASPMEATFEFHLSGITHDKSSVLTEDEIQKAVAPWVGQTINAKDLSKILNAINGLYQQKGYVVCMAMLKPQRIKDGVLHITLMEGKTDEVSVTGNEHTSTSYILSAFDFEKGQVANYSDMYDDLVEFNMTNDVLLTVDIRPGSQEQTTSYMIGVHEPDNWTGAIFADTTGAKSTGRPRLGASITNRSVLGRRDAATLLGTVSQGSKSVLATYSMPLTAKGTKITGGVSYGEVDIISGPSRSMDVTGDSLLWNVRLDHPVWVTNDMKWTAFAEYTRRDSQTDVFDSIRMNDTEIDTVSLGLETIYLGQASLFYLNNSLVAADAKDNVFEDNDRDYKFFKGNLMARVSATDTVKFTLTGAWQAKLSGDDMMTADYFYLGHVSGVRGYENDILSAENGFYVNAQAGWNFLGPETELYVFWDYGRLSGLNPYTAKKLSSVGLGVRWPLFKGASIEVVGSVPLYKDIDEAGHVSSARADITATILW